MNRSQTAAFFGVAMTTLDYWREQGCPHRVDGKAVLFNSRELFEWRLQRVVTESRPNGEVSDGEIRWRREWADMERAERQNAIESGQVGRIDEMAEKWTDQMLRIAARFDAMPARFGMAVAYACAALVPDATPDLIDEMRKAAEVKLQEAADELRLDIASGQTVPDLEVSEPSPDASAA